MIKIFSRKLLNKISLYLLFFLFLNYTACYSTITVSKEKLFSRNRNEPVNDITIFTTDDERILIGEATFEVISDTVHIEGIQNSYTDTYGDFIKVKIALSDIQKVEIEVKNEEETTGCIVAFSSAVVLITILGIVIASHPNN